MAKRSPWVLADIEARLFGAGVMVERSRLRLSVEGLATDSPRTEEWFRAVERGELCLTRRMCVVVGAAFDRRTPPGDDVLDIDDLVVKVRTEPNCPMCSALREHTHQVVSIQSEPATDLARGELELIGKQDWLKVVGPWLLLSATLYCLALSLALAGGEPRIASASDTASPLVPLTALCAALTSLAIRPSNAVTRWLGGRARTKAARRHITAARWRCTRDQISWPSLDLWDVEPLLPFILNAYRDRVQRVALRTDLTERCVIALYLGALVSGIGFAYSTFVHDDGWYAMLPLSLAVATGLAGRAAASQSLRGAYEMRWLIHVGLGSRIEHRKSKTTAGPTPTSRRNAA